MTVLSGVYTHMRHNYKLKQNIVTFCFSFVAHKTPYLGNIQFLESHKITP